MKQRTKGEKQTASAPKPMTIVLQPGQELRVIADDGSGAVSRSALGAMGAMGAMATGAGETDISPSRDPDTDISPSASKDLSGRP